MKAFMTHGDVKTAPARWSPLRRELLRGAAAVEIGVGASLAAGPLLDVRHVFPVRELLVADDSLSFQVLEQGEGWRSCSAAASRTRHERG